MKVKSKSKTETKFLVKLTREEAEQFTEYLGRTSMTTTRAVLGLLSEGESARSINSLLGELYNRLADELAGLE